MSQHKTAAILVIGNEVLSGRTREANAYLAAQKLFDRGCKLGEIAVVPDIQDAIVVTLNRSSFSLIRIFSRVSRFSTNRPGSDPIST